MGKQLQVTGIIPQEELPHSVKHKTDSVEGKFPSGPSKELGRKVGFKVFAAALGEWKALKADPACRKPKVQTVSLWYRPTDCTRPRTNSRHPFLWAIKTEAFMYSRPVSVVHASPWKNINHFPQARCDFLTLE